MTDDKRPEGATSGRPLHETIAGTGPGIPDDALAPGAELPAPPTDEQVAAAAKAIGAPVPKPDGQASD